MDLKDVLRKRLDAQLSGTDWHVLEYQPDLSSVRFWLYSINMVSGPRLAGQATAEFYRDLKAGTGIFKELSSNGMTPNSLMGTVLKAYDEELDPAERQLLLQPFMVALGFFARSTRSWEILEPLSEVEGIHFFVADWTTGSGEGVVRPMVMYGKDIPGREAIIEGLAIQLAMHLARFPNESPFEFS